MKIQTMGVEVRGEGRGEKGAGQGSGGSSKQLKVGGHSGSQASPGVRSTSIKNEGRTGAAIHHLPSYIIQGRRDPTWRITWS